jgi:hypothetical protein
LTDKRQHPDNYDDYNSDDGRPWLFAAGGDADDPTRQRQPDPADPDPGWVFSRERRRPDRKRRK